MKLYTKNRFDFSELKVLCLPTQVGGATALGENSSAVLRRVVMRENSAKIQGGAMDGPPLGFASTMSELLVTCGLHVIWCFLVNIDSNSPCHHVSITASQRDAELQSAT